MKVTPQIEKTFFSYIRKNPYLAEKVSYLFFKTPELQLLFKVFKSYLYETNYMSVPTTTQLVEMAKCEDVRDEFDIETLTLASSTNLDEYDEEEYIKPRFKAWVASNSFRKELVDIIEISRKLNELDLENVEETILTAKELIGKASLIRWDDSDLGADFDDPASHFQDNIKTVVRTGWKTWDMLLGGGWRAKTLNVLTAAPGVGKSQFLCNIASNVADNGKNVCYATFELSKEQVMKRIGCKRLRIPSDKYDELSRDERYMRDRIRNFNSSRISDDVTFGGNYGKLWVKEWPTGTCTIYDLDEWIKKIQEVKSKKVHVLCVDYIQIMRAELGKTTTDNLYLKGKHIAEGLRALAMKHDLVVVTATQIDKSMYGANDAFLEDIPESKAIGETADFVFGIICTDSMKNKNLYRIKGLKFRSTEFSQEQIIFDFNKEYLSIENDRFYEQN